MYYIGGIFCAVSIYEKESFFIRWKSYRTLWMRSARETGIAIWKILGTWKRFRK